MDTLQELQVLYDSMREKLDVQAEAKLQQIALDLALKDGVDQVTQSYLDQAEAQVQASAETDKAIGDLTKLGNTVGQWANTVGGLYKNLYDNKKMIRDKDMNEEIEAGIFMLDHNFFDHIFIYLNFFLYGTNKFIYNKIY